MFMKRIGTSLICFLVCLAGCAPAMSPMVGPKPIITSTTPSTIPQVQAIPWDEKPRVAVMEFENKTGTHYQTIRTSRGYAVGDPIGGGMKEQLVTALHQTGAFIVLERQAVKDVIGEQDFGASGRVRREAASAIEEAVEKTGRQPQVRVTVEIPASEDPNSLDRKGAEELAKALRQTGQFEVATVSSPAIGEIEGAEFLIYGAVTEYTPGQASTGEGVGIGSTGGALLGIPGGALIGGLAEQAVAGSMSQNHVAIDIRLVDARTGRVVNATSVRASANDLGGTFGGIFGTTLLGVSGSYQEPMQRAVRAANIKAVNWIAESVKDYRGGGPQMISTKGPIGPPSRGKPAGPPSELVRQTQRDLNALGYDCGQPDGVLGPKTRAAIDRFVRDSGISVEGSLGSTAVLRTISQELQKRRPPTPVVRKSGGGESQESLESFEAEWGY